MDFNFHIGLPQGIIIFFMIVNLLTNIVKHGESKGEYNAFISFSDALITLTILYWGGFFR
jgi:uncharacterized membrane protein